MKKKVQIFIAIGVTLALLGGVATTAYILLNRDTSVTKQKGTSKSLDIDTLPEDYVVREEYLQEEQKFKDLTTNYTIAQIQEIEDKTPVRFNRYTGEMNLKESDILITPKVEEVVYSNTHALTLHTAGKDVAISLDKRPLSEVRAEISNSEGCTILQDDENALVYYSDLFSYKVVPAPVRDRCISFAVLSVGDDTVEMFKDFGVKDVGINA